MIDRKLFLKWALVNVLAFMFFAILMTLGFASGLTGAPRLATVAIAIIAVVFSAYGGRLAWKTDVAVESGVAMTSMMQVEHDLDHLFHAIWLCQILGIVGALLGYRQEASHAATTGDPSAAIHAVFAGLGNGLIATLAGVLFSLLFFIEHRIIDHVVVRELRVPK